MVWRHHSGRSCHHKSCPRAPHLSSAGHWPTSLRPQVTCFSSTHPVYPAMAPAEAGLPGPAAGSAAVGLGAGGASGRESPGPEGGQSGASLGGRPTSSSRGPPAPSCALEPGPLNGFLREWEQTGNEEMRCRLINHYEGARQRLPGEKPQMPRQATGGRRQGRSESWSRGESRASQSDGGRGGEGSFPASASSEQPAYRPKSILNPFACETSGSSEGGLMPRQTARSLPPGSAGPRPGSAGGV